MVGLHGMSAPAHRPPPLALVVVLAHAGGLGRWHRAIGGQYQIQEFVLDLAQLLRMLNQFPVTLVAHSLGAAVALQYTGIFPQNVRGLGRAAEGERLRAVEDERLRAEEDARLRDCRRAVEGKPVEGAGCMAPGPNLLSEVPQSLSLVR